MNGFIYTLLFEKPICDGHPAQTYTGFTFDLAARIQAHRLGNGARLTQVAKERGIGFEVVRVWRGGRGVERRIKNLKNGRALAYGERNVAFAPELSQEEIAELLIPF